MGNKITQYSENNIMELLDKQGIYYAATMGFDKQPKVHPVKLCYRDNAAIYFAAGKSEMFYGELSMSAATVLSSYDNNDDIIIKITGKPVFTEEQEIVDNCLENNDLLNKRYGANKEMVIAWFLKDMEVELSSLADDKTSKIVLGTPDNVLTGITIKKDNEIRDRLTKIMESRAAESISSLSEDELYLQKLYDGAVLYFAETAKEVWPRMNIMPIENAVIYETYDEREQFTLKAKKLIGNKVIDKPEDLTYWLNKETLLELDKK